VANHSLELEFVAVKAFMFSFSRLVGADPMLGVEMSSTGEVGCFRDDQHEALLHALVATGFRQPKRGVLLSLGPFQEEYWFADKARILADELGLPIYATPGTAETLQGLGITAIRLEKRDSPDGPSVRSRRGRSTWSSIFLSNTMTSASPMVAGSVALPWTWACH
jgi:carbamoyl-phosphate synthase large subunit